MEDDPCPLDFREETPKESKNRKLDGSNGKSPADFGAVGDLLCFFEVTEQIGLSDDF